MINLRAALLCLVTGFGVTIGQIRSRRGRRSEARAFRPARRRHHRRERHPHQCAQACPPGSSRSARRSSRSTCPIATAKRDDVVLGYDTAAEYLAKPQYFGATVGRYANRIAQRQVHARRQANTRSRPTTGPTICMAGCAGFDKRCGRSNRSKAVASASVILAYLSPDGEGGYPGTLNVTATYSLSRRQRAEHRVPRDDGQADDRQHHQSRLLQPRRRARGARRDGRAAHAACRPPTRRSTQR